jgi:hypothetical protein
MAAEPATNPTLGTQGPPTGQRGSGRAVPEWLQELVEWATSHLVNLRWLYVLDAVAFAYVLHHLVESMWFPSAGALMSRWIVAMVALAVFALASHSLAHGSGKHHRDQDPTAPRPLRTVTIWLMAAGVAALLSFSSHQVLLGRCVVEPPEDLPQEISAAAGVASHGQRHHDPAQGVSEDAVLVPVVHPSPLVLVIAEHEHHPILAINADKTGFRRAAASAPSLVLGTQLLFLMAGIGTGIGLAISFAAANRAFRDAIEWRRALLRNSPPHNAPARPAARSWFFRRILPLLIWLLRPGPIVILLGLGLLLSSLRRALGLVNFIELHPFIDGPVRAIAVLLAILVTEVVLAAMLLGKFSGPRRLIAVLVAAVLAASSLTAFLYTQNKCTVLAGEGDHGRLVYRPVLLPDRVEQEVRGLRKDLAAAPEEQWAKAYDEFLREDSERFEDDCRYFAPHLLAMSTCLLAFTALLLIASFIAAFVLLGDMFTGIFAPTGDGLLTELINWCIERLEELQPDLQAPASRLSEPPLITTVRPDAGGLQVLPPVPSAAAGRASTHE